MSSFSMSSFDRVPQPGFLLVCFSVHVDCVARHESSSSRRQIAITVPLELNIDLAALAYSRTAVFSRRAYINEQANSSRCERCALDTCIRKTRSAGEKSIGSRRGWGSCRICALDHRLRQCRSATAKVFGLIPSAPQRFSQGGSAGQSTRGTFAESGLERSKAAGRLCLRNCWPVEAAVPHVRHADF